MLYAVDVFAEKAKDDPSLITSDALRAAANRDLAGVAAHGEKGLLEVVNASHSGMSVAEFQANARRWLDETPHPKFDRPIGELVYQPMLELLAYLRDNAFKTYIVSGGGIDFIRGIAEDTYGIPPEQVVGSMGNLEYEIVDGVPTVMKKGGIAFIDDKSGKPVGIMRRIGKRPIFAGGNSDGDFEMLEWTTAGDGPRFGLLVHHTDAKREWAYDRESHIGQLVRGLDEGPDRGWLIVDMESDWLSVFPPQSLGRKCVNGVPPMTSSQQDNFAASTPTLGDVWKMLEARGWLSERSPEVRDKLLGIAQVRVYQPGEHLYSVGEEPQGVYGVARGALDISIAREDGEEIVVHNAQPGFWVGDLALFSSQRRLVTATAATEVIAAFLSKGPALAIARPISQTDLGLLRPVASQRCNNLATARQPLDSARRRAHRTPSAHLRPETNKNRRLAAYLPAKAGAADRPVAADSTTYAPKPRGLGHRRTRVWPPACMRQLEAAGPLQLIARRNPEFHQLM